MQFTTTCSADCEGWSERLVAAEVRRWFPTPLQHHCVIRWAVSSLITKAYIQASCHGVVRRFVRDRWRVIDPRVSLSSDFFVTCTRCFSSYFDDFLSLSLSVHRHLLRNVFRTAVRCDCASCSRSFSLALHAGATHAFELCVLVFSFLCDTYRPLNEVSSLLVAVHSLSAERGSLC